MSRTAAGASAVLAGLFALAISTRDVDAQACARPNIPAMVVHAAEADVPAMAQQQGIGGNVQVVVSLDANNRVTAARIQSSPSAILNAAALRAARESTFQTEFRNCAPIAADYVFNVVFPVDPQIGTSSGGPIVVITGQGVASRPPDVATLSAGIVTNDDDSAAAAAKNAAIYDALKTRLRALGVDEKNLTSTSYTVTFFPRPGATPDPRPPTPTPFAAYQVPQLRFGYVASRTLQISVTNVANAGAAVDAALAAGATSVSGVQFSLLDRRAAYAEALAAAIKDAANQAEVVAAASRLHVAGIKQIQVGQNVAGPPPPAPGPLRSSTSPSAGTELRPAPIDVRASVSVTYLLKL